MDAKFLTLTGVLAAVAFGGVWIATSPAASEEAAISHERSTATAPLKSKPHLIVAAPPEDVEPVSAFAEPAPAAGPRASASSAVYYSGCNAARAAGAAPIYRGQPGYRPEMDGDGDGIACEPHRY